MILILGFYLRIGGALSGSFAFTYDVGRDMLQMQDIAVNHKIPLIGQTSGLGGLFYGPWWYYILTPAYIISAGNPQGVALFMVLVGVAAIVTGFFLGKRIGSLYLGILIAGFLSFSAVMISSSVQIWNPNTAPFFVLLFFLCFFVETGKKYKSILLNLFCGILLGLILDSEIVFGVLFIAGLGAASITVLRKEIFSKRLIFLIAGFVFTLLPRLFFELRHGFVMTKSLTNISDEQSILNIKDFFHVLPERLAVFLSLFSETFGINVLISTVICILIVPLWLWLGKKAPQNIRKLFFTCLIILLIFLTGSSFFARAIWGHYLVAVPVLYILILSIFLYSITKRYKILGIILSIIFLVATVRPLDVVSNIQNSNWEGDAAVYRNQVAVIDYIYKNADGKKFNYTAYTPSVHDYPYRYLFSWYGMNKYGYTPDTDAQKELYVILEPDPGYEGRLTNWLKIREGDGKIINENTIKGGIKVQKRVR